MISAIKRHPLVQRVYSLLGRLDDQMTPALVRRRAFRVASLAIIGAIVYWGGVASDRYVSEAHVVIHRTDMSNAGAVDFASIFSGGQSTHDLMLLRDHLQSVDMMNKLQQNLALREHFSDPTRDFLSRLWSRDVSQERFHEHYLSRVSVAMDDLAGVLVIKSQAYEPVKAKEMTEALVAEGERFMNDMAHRLASEQVSFLERQVSELGERARKARLKVLTFQNDKGLVSPQATLEGIASVTTQFENQLAELKAKRGAMIAFLSQDAPDVVKLDQQINAIEKQLAQERSRLASPRSGALNRTVEEMQRLQLEAELTQDMYRSALIALEKGRVEAIRTLKKVSIVQNPTTPEYAVEPRRLYNITVFALVVLLAAGVFHLLAAIIRDHQD